MSTFEKNMEQIFDVAPTPQQAPVVKKQQLPLAVTEENLEEDLVDAYEQTKENLQELIEQGKEAMADILQIAKDGQHPRAFEVYGTLLKNVVDANKELLAVQKQMRTMDKKQSASGSTTIDKAIFVGTTAEFNKLLKGTDE